ncbi:DUF3099 domain-containing protein [Streptomyces sp. NPDC049040]|uniref:DUF3099 domain-containing protein n=1 Tax=Streptomyces sp. NPDC049040 TaxID=3365593 RepID=UPI003719F56B
MDARRRHWYFAMMGTCLVLFVMAWAVVRIWSIPAAIGMCLVAAVIPPFAAIVANRRGPHERWFDEPPEESDTRDDRTPAPRARTGDPESDAWWDEIEGRNRKDRRR